MTQISGKRRKAKNKRRRENNKQQNRERRMKKEILDKENRAAFQSTSPTDQRVSVIPKKYEEWTPEQPKVPVLNIDVEERNTAMDLMRTIFEVQSTSGDQYEMMDFITNFVKGMQSDGVPVRFDLDSSHNIYITKGKAKTYPCIVAHMDTVHRIIPHKDFKVLNSETEFFAVNLNTKQPTGVGGDDNCGIYCALDNLLREDDIKIAFFVDEEIGCVGSADSDPAWFDDVSFVFQADRQGYADVANNIMYTQMFGDEFEHTISDVLTRYNRSVCEGGMTDVMQLAHNGVDVCMANFSCGYYKPHTSQEYVVIDELILTSIMFRDLIKTAYVDGERHTIERADEDYNSYAYYGGYYEKPKSKGKVRTIGSLGDRATSNNTSNGYSELESDDDGMSSTKRIHETSTKTFHSTEECTYCGQTTIWDDTMDMGFCNNCMDYDYNSSGRKEIFE